MLDDKRLEEIKKTVAQLRNTKDIETNEQHKRLAPFFIKNALTSLNTAKILDMASSNIKIKGYFDFLDEDFESYLWIINSSYYSMFYLAGALLAKLGLKVKSEIGVHKKTYFALVYYFYLSGRMAKQYVEEFEEAQKESQELLGLMQKKVKDLMINYDFEMDKRSFFTYNIGIRAKNEKASTSLKRAIEFYNECLKVMDKL